MHDTVVHDDGADTGSAAAVRSDLLRVGARLGMPAPACEDLALVATELVTNAVRAGAGALRVSVTQPRRGSVRVAVADDAPGMPHLRDAGSGDVSGRGLRIVQALASDWGCEPAPAGRKAVWAVLCYSEAGSPDVRYPDDAALS